MADPIRLLILDTETTGLDEMVEEIVEIGAILIEADQNTGIISRTIGNYHELREPDVPLSAEASRINGITIDDLRGKRLDCKAFSNLLNQADILLAHNAKFDRRFIGRLFADTLDKAWFCSMECVPWKTLGFQSKSLSRIAAQLGIETKQDHRAFSDCELVVEVLRQDLLGRTVLKWIFDKGPAFVPRPHMDSCTRLTSRILEFLGIQEIAESCR
jgi:DNA polymerase-3 subunit epsilon